MKLVSKSICFLLMVILITIFSLGSNLIGANSASTNFYILYLAEDGKIYECEPDGSSTEVFLEIESKKIEHFWLRPDGEQLIYRLAGKWPRGVEDEKKVTCLYSLDNGSHEILSQADFQNIPWIEKEWVFKKPIFSPNGEYLCRYDQEGPGLKIYKIQTGKVVNNHTTVYNYPSCYPPPDPIWDKNSRGVVCQVGFYDYDKEIMYNTLIRLGVNGSKKKLPFVYNTEHNMDFLLIDYNGELVIFFYRRNSKAPYRLYSTNLKAVSLIKEGVITAYFLRSVPIALPTIRQ